MKQLTVKQAAEMAGVSPRRIRHLCMSNRLAGAVKLGRDWLIPESAVHYTRRRVRKETGDETNNR